MIAGELHYGKLLHLKSCKGAESEIWHGCTCHIYVCAQLASLLAKLGAVTKQRDALEVRDVGCCLKWLPAD